MQIRRRGASCERTLPAAVPARGLRPRPFPAHWRRGTGAFSALTTSPCHAEIPTPCSPCRGLGCDVTENAWVHFGEDMVNFHRPATWQCETFTLRAPAAKPPCGDLCFVWEGTPESLKALLDCAGAKIIEGPVARQGGRRKAGCKIQPSIFLRFLRERNQRWEHPSLRG